MADIAVVENAAVARRMRLCVDILSLREKLAAVDPGKATNARALAKKRIGAIRRVLLGHPGQNLSDELLLPSMGYRRLAEILKSAKAGSEAERHEAEAYADGIYRMLKSVDNAGEQTGIGFAHGEKEFIEARNDFGGTKIFEAVNSLVDATIERGKFGEALREEIAHAASSPDPSSLRLDEVAPELKARESEVESEVSAVKAAYSKAHADYRGAVTRLNAAIDSEASQEEITRLSAEQEAAADVEVKAYQDYCAFSSAKYDEHYAAVKQAMDKAREEAQAPVVAVGAKAINALLGSSPITPDAAIAWANGVEITKTAIARLRKLGYPLDQVRADMADFYRLTGGRVGAVRLDSSGDRRANAPGIYAVGNAGSVMMGSEFNKRVLWHELGHHIEADPMARATAGRFIRRRSTTGDKTATLRSLTGNKGYGSSEIAFPDGFFNPYVGKVYRDGVTEVFSMGVESFSDPLTLGRRMIADPQTLEFVSGYLKAEQSPLAKAYMALRESLREINDDAKAEKKSGVAQLLEKLASRVELIPDTDTQWAVAKGVDWMISSLKLKQIGRLDGEWYVFSGKVRNPETRRKGNGLYLVRGREGYFDQTPFASTDITVLRAMFAIYTKLGYMPSSYKMYDESFLREQANDN